MRGEEGGLDASSLFPIGILGKPSFAYALFLFKELFDAPK
jgi:hypothetical protein